MINWGVVTPTVGKGSVAKVSVAQHELNCFLECTDELQCVSCTKETFMALVSKALCSTHARSDTHLLSQVFFFAVGPAVFCHGACVRRGGTRTALCLRGRRSSSTGLDVDHAYAETATIGANCFFAASIVTAPQPEPILQSPRGLQSSTS